MFVNIQIDLLVLKKYYGQFTLTTKKSLHIIFNIAIDLFTCDKKFVNFASGTSES